MRKRKVVFHRIVGVQAAQAPGYFLSGTPGQISAPGQSEKSGDAVDMGVERNDKHVRGQRPQPEVNAVGGPDHPAHVKIQPLAGALSTRRRDKMRQTAIRTSLSDERRQVQIPQSLHPAVERFTPMPVCQPQALRGDRSHRAVFSLKATGCENEGAQLARSGHPVQKPTSGRQHLFRRRMLRKRRRTWPDNIQESRQTRLEQVNSPVCDGTGEKPDNFLIVGVCIPMNELDRVVGSVGCVISAGKHSVK